MSSLAPKYPEDLPPSNSGQYYNTIAGHGRSKPHAGSASHSASSSSSSQHMTAGSDHKYMTLGSGRSLHSPLLAQKSDNELYSSSADYANMTSSGQPLIANVDGLKLSHATSKSRRVLDRIRRPLPDLPPGEPVTFSAADLPPDFKGLHKPEILISGCINYSACVSSIKTCLIVLICEGFDRQSSFHNKMILFL